MTRDSKKRRERAALDFLIDQVDLGISVSEVVERESPDFLVRGADGSTFGVEVVELADGGLAAGMAGYRRLKAELEARMKAEDLNVLVSLRTRGGFLPRLNEGPVTRSHVDGLYQLVAAHVAADEGERAYERDELRPRGIDWIVRVGIYPSGEPAVMANAQTVGFGLPSHVQKHVDAKNAKVETYRENVDGPVWLLLLGGVRFASGVWSELIRDRRLESDFDRVFYVDAYDGAAFEVMTPEAPIEESR